MYVFIGDFMGLGFTIPLLVYVGKKSHKIYGFMCLGEFPEPPSSAWSFFPHKQKVGSYSPNNSPIHAKTPLNA